MNIHDPKFIDPMYRPYQTNYSKSPLRFPNVINSPYPIVDPYRRHLGKGQTFRSQHEGYCPPTWMKTNRNKCVKMEPEAWGTFYTEAGNPDKLLKYSNNKIPSNADMCCDSSKIAEANGWNDNLRINMASCIKTNFW